MIQNKRYSTFNPSVQWMQRTSLWRKTAFPIIIRQNSLFELYSVVWKRLFLVNVQLSLQFACCWVFICLLCYSGFYLTFVLFVVFIFAWHCYCCCHFVWSLFKLRYLTHFQALFHASNNLAPMPCPKTRRQQITNNNNNNENGNNNDKRENGTEATLTRNRCRNNSVYEQTVYESMLYKKKHFQKTFGILSIFGCDCVCVCKLHTNIIAYNMHKRKITSSPLEPPIRNQYALYWLCIDYNYICIHGKIDNKRQTTKI